MADEVLMKNCISFTRARSEDQIESRTDAILIAAADLYERHRYDEITFAMIGKEAKFTRSNLYRYFKSKEEVFLELLSNDIQKWSESLSALPSKKVKPLVLAEAWVSVTLEFPRMLRLLRILTSILEHNVSDEVLRNFKIRMNVTLVDACAQLVNQGLFKNEAGAHQFIFAQSNLLSGIYGMYNMSDRQAKILAELNSIHEPEYYRSIMVTSVAQLLTPL